MYYVSMLMVIDSSILYHVSQKSIPKALNPLISMLITYLTAVTITGMLLLVFSISVGKWELEMRPINWTSIALGIAPMFMKLILKLANQYSHITSNLHKNSLDT